MSETTTKRMEDIVALCRRRGFIFQSSEIYGGINGFWDYGPNGVELKRNLKDAWWGDIVHGDATGPTGNVAGNGAERAAGADAADAFRNSRFKLIPRVSEGGWVLQKAVGTKPALIGNKLRQSYYGSEEKR